jgi:hypothetical protein
MFIKETELSQDIVQLTEEIRTYQEMENEAKFEIGRRLKHVKENDLARGEWYEWLESIGFNQRTAQRYMQVYERFNCVEGAEVLPISKLTELLSLPVDVDGKEFVEKAKTQSVRQLREEVRTVKAVKGTKGECADKAERKQPTYIDQATEGLRNLIPDFERELEEGEINLDDAALVGQESKEVQRKVWQLGAGIDVSHALMLARMTPNDEVEVIVELLCQLRDGCKRYRINFGGLGGEIEKYYGNGDYIGFKEKLEGCVG